MFKLESYITPIILSYVGKYIKNFKWEDSQLSLWSGEVTFHNLDLRLEVLEEELQLPFSFVSGHIHELIIHVPWTKLNSEPICITINTIECILKLPGGEAQCIESGSGGSTLKERRKRLHKPADVGTPPGYVQSLVNRIVSNITIKCCNLIVKYVEEDIVMSMNVKNLIFQSANSSWEPDFTDLSPSELMLRKIISLTDVTVCLDKRNASGKIDSYLEPVLYRCSLMLRLLRSYSSPSSQRAVSVRLDMHCHQMTFSISELQIPMMMRLLLLVRALINKDVGVRPLETETEVDESDDDCDTSATQESWTGWAWNLVPSMIPRSGWAYDWTEEDSHTGGHTFHFGVYIDNLTFNFRIGETYSTEKSSWKSKTDPFLSLALGGCLINSISHGCVWVNSQLGISRIQLEPAGPCSCGANDSSHKPTVFFESGLYQDNYSADSLFSPSAAENQGVKYDYNLSWDLHQTIVSESNLLEKTPALAIDFLYTIELPDNFSPEKVLEFNGDFEYSNLPEHVLCRFVTGPLILRASPGMLHRFEKVYEAGALYDYQPYETPHPEDRRDQLPTVTAEEYDSLEENIPLRTYQFTFFKPKIEFQLAEHSAISSSCKRIDTASQHLDSSISVECQCIDARFIAPMYPRRLVRSACLLPLLPSDMFHACHSHSIVRVLHLTSHINSSTESFKIFSVDNISCKLKELLLKHLWDNPELLHVENSFEAICATLTVSKAQLHLIHVVFMFLFSEGSLDDLIHSSLLSDVFSQDDKVLLEVTGQNIVWQKGLTVFTRCDTITLMRVTTALQMTSKLGSEVKTVILSGPSENQDSCSLSSPFFKAFSQWPREPGKQSHAPLLLMNVDGAFISLDPLLCAWLRYSPTIVSFQANVQSGRVGQRKVSDVSHGQPASERARRSQTPLSVHSSEKDRDVVLPPMVTQLSFISSENSNFHSSTAQEQPISKWLLEWFPIWQGVVLHIDIAAWHLNVPMSSSKSDQMETEASVNGITLQLPNLKLSSGTSSHRSPQFAFSSITKLPAHLPASVWTQGNSNFPWNMSLSDLSMWSVINGCSQYLLKPVTTKCTVGISTRFADSNKESLISLGLCIHNDTGALRLTMNKVQVQMLSSVLLSVAVVSRSIFSSYNAGHAPPAIPTPRSPTTMSESASISDSRYVTDSTELTEPVKLSVWMQWTLARASANFYQFYENMGGVKQHMKLAVEIEDLMASLDLQQVYSKLKLKVAGANIYHYVRGVNDTEWKMAPYNGLVMCGYEEISPSASGQVLSDDGCGFFTATLTRARCHSVHNRWGTHVSGTSSKFSLDSKTESKSHSSNACFITEVLITLQPLHFLFSMESLTQWVPLLQPFSLFLEKVSSDTCNVSKTIGAPPTSNLPSICSSSLPLLYLDLQAVRILLPLDKNVGHHDTFILQFDSITLSPHAENPLLRAPTRPDIYHMAEQARILSVPGSEVEDRQYELNIVGLSVSTGQWQEMERCRRMSASSPASSLRTMSENPALVWNSLAQNVSSLPQPSLITVLAPLKICVVAAPAIVYRNKILVCGHSLEINAVSDISLVSTTNHLRLVAALISEMQTVIQNLRSKPASFNTPISSFVMELAEEQQRRLQDTVGVESVILCDSGIDTADMSSSGTPYCSRPRGMRRLSRSPRSIESVHGSSSGPLPSYIHSRTRKLDRDVFNKVVQDQTTDLLTRSSFSFRERIPSVSENANIRDRFVEFPIDLLVTGRSISFMLYEDPVVEKREEANHEGSTCVRTPLIYFLLHQPHVYFSQISRSASMQVSAYDALIKLGLCTEHPVAEPSFKESDFPSILFESRKGVPDPINGVPPPLIIVQSTFTSEKPAQVTVTCGRPAKLSLSTVNLLGMQHVLKNVFSCIIQSTEEPIHTAGYRAVPNGTNGILGWLSCLSSLKVSSSQIIIAFQSKNEHHIESQVEISLSSLSGEVLCFGRIRWGSHMGSVERAMLNMECEGLGIACSHSEARSFLLQPCNLSYRLELQWPAWLPRHLILSLPHIQLSVKSDCLKIGISPDHICGISNLLNGYLPFVNAADMHNGPVNVCVSTPVSEMYSSENEGVDLEQHYTDDLRAGAFQFMDATNTMERNHLPLPYQCVFWESYPPAIAWRYPQPRSITSVHVFPVPFKSSEDAESGKEVVVCSLQYWSECRGSYQPYSTFLLSETKDSLLDLPPPPVCAVSATWRVLLAGTQELSELDFTVTTDISSNNSDISVVSPRVLAACMRVDSFFSASLAPNLQIALNVTFIEFSTINHISEGVKQLPSPVQNYYFDGRSPSPHSFMWTSMHHTALFYSSWPEGRKLIDISSLLKCDVLDYMTLTQISVIEPFLLHFTASSNADDSFDISFLSRGIVLRLCPSVAHTLASSTTLWQQELLGDNTKRVQVLLMKYILCNDTVFSLEIGQVGTDENILLHSKHFHTYAWRAASKKPMLHLTLLDSSLLQDGKQSWSSSFSPDCLGTQTCKIKCASSKDLILFVKVVSISEAQKQVIIRGQVMLSNMLSKALDVRLVRPASDWSLETCSASLPVQPGSSGPTLVLDRSADDPQLGIRVRLRHPDGNLWTGDIPLRENQKSNQPWLVKVPLHDKGEFICIWCRVIRQKINGYLKILVILSPMYALCSHLPLPNELVTMNDQDPSRKIMFELPGQGEILELNLPGSLLESTHQVHLRCSSSVKVFPLEYSSIDHRLIFPSLQHVDIDSVLESLEQSRKRPWPLPDHELSSYQWICADHPIPYVQAFYGPLSPYCGTLLLELRPWALFVNQLGRPVCVQHSGEKFLLPSRGIVAPPKLEGTFQIGMTLHEDKDWEFSDALQFARADWGKSFYMPRIAGLIPDEGQVQILVKAEPLACLLTLGSQIYNEMRVFSIRPSFVVSNSCSAPLRVTPLAVRHLNMNTRLPVPSLDAPETVLASFTLQQSTDQRGYPLEKWMHLKSCEADIVPYLAVSTLDGRMLSCPLRITGCPPRRKFSVPFGSSNCNNGSDFCALQTKSLVLSVVESSGQTFLNISDEMHPDIIIHNSCDFRILVTSVNSSTRESKPSMEAGIWDWVCAVDPRCAVHYNIASNDHIFPQITQTLPQHSFFLAVDSGSSHMVTWSSGIQLPASQEQFISLPGHGDVKVHLWSECFTTHVLVETVSRVEISARDIRSRLLTVPPCSSERLESGLPVSSLEVVVAPVTMDPVTGKTTCEESDKLCHQDKTEGRRHFTVRIAAFLQSLSCTLASAATTHDNCEISSLMLDNVSFISHPVLTTSPQSKFSENSIQITIGDFQLDNHLFGKGGFDFPVVLMGQNGNSHPVHNTFSLNMSASELVGKFSSHALIAVNVLFESGIGLTFVPKALHVSVGPLTAYIEDTFIAHLSKHTAAFFSPVIAVWEQRKMETVDQQLSESDPWINPPLAVSIELQVLDQPLRLTSLTFDPVWLLLSVHSSTRLYIALDRSPLQFSQFCRRSLYTTSYNLGHTLTMHYLSGAIFGAGWVVGSLELLGSPGGFARTLGTGLRDFVSLPYKGILQGPWGFIVGITHGSASLMKHFTAGTLNSVTKMASSVARNLDRLTLDSEHLERTEELRRVRPQGVAEGLMQGLTGFGISLLGAVAGLAHHPLQSVMSGEPSPRGVVTGVGRGIVGIITKPLSGAADLVALTGQGLLQGAGWNNLPQPRHTPKSEEYWGRGCTVIKHSFKIQPFSPSLCLSVLEATSETTGSRFKAVTLVLTSERLVLLGADNDTVEASFVLTEVELPETVVDPTLLTISFKNTLLEVDRRMWDFVNGCHYGFGSGPPALDNYDDLRPTTPPPLSTTPSLHSHTVDHHSSTEAEDTNPNLKLSCSSSDDGTVSLSTVQPAENSASRATRPSLVFHVNPQIHGQFLSLLKIAQSQCEGKGFQVL